METLDAVLIPGGGLLETGEVVPWVRPRLDRAIALTPPPQFFIPLSAGTTHKPPPLDAAGFPILEAVAAGQYLMRQGIEGTRILPETISLDTIGNAYFARVKHTDPLQLRRLHVITSDFHLPRVRAIFDWIFGLSAPVKTYQLTFEAVPDVGIEAAVLQARRDREQASLAKVQALRSQLQTLSDVHRWLYAEHSAYTIAQSPQRLSGTALLTY
jgi:uncharacterized SAM-binding protein YcdF (DUF218 family)